MICYFKDQAIWFETLSNPTMKIIDIQRLPILFMEQIKMRWCALITILDPVYQQPLRKVLMSLSQ